LPEQVAPWADQADQKDYFPRKELWKKFGDMGLHGLTVDEAYGGTNMGYLAHAICAEEISRTAGGIGLSYIAHSNLCINQIQLHGTPEQKNKHLPKLVSGIHCGSLSMSEPNAGSDVMSMKTFAKKDGDSFILNGSKQWCTNATESDVFVIYAKSDSENPKKMTAFLVERDTPGFKIGPKLDKIGMRGSPTAPLYFENCRIPEQNVLGSLHGGSEVLMSGLNYERLIIASGPVGIMQSCLDVAIPYCFERKQFGKVLGRFQLMQGKLADMYVSLQSSRAFLYSTAMAADNGNTDNKNCAAVLLHCSENCVKVALEAIQCLGGNGYCNEYPTGRLLRDSKLYDIGAGTNEIRRFIIGRELGDEILY
jgi:isovaleryl-CoA dehydrogenase